MCCSYLLFLLNILECFVSKLIVGSKRTYSECPVDKKAIKRDNVHPYILFCMDCVARDNGTKAYDLESLLHLYFQVSTNVFFPK